MATSAAAAETASSAIRSELLAMGTRSPATAPSVAIPTRASSACCSSAVTSTPSRRPTRDGRNGIRRGGGSTGAGAPTPLAAPAPGAAHAPGDGRRSRPVRDEQRVGRQLAHDVVERLQPLAGAGVAHDEEAARNGGGIEGRGRVLFAPLRA